MTLQEETFDIPDTETRYVRYLGHGNSANTWNSLTEVDILAADIRYTRAAVASATASTSDGNLPHNVLDGNLGTRWSASGDGQWLTLDLGAPLTVGLVELAFSDSGTRQYTFDLQVSTDNTTWTTVWSGHSGGAGSGLESVDFTDVPARYVRYLGHGNSIDPGNSLTEAEVDVVSGQSQHLSLGTDGRLGYPPYANGDTIPDFSRAGYGGGGVALPVVPARKTVSPVTGEGGTVIKATGTSTRTVINVAGRANRAEVSGTRQRITDAYVPVGAHSFTVADASGFRVGDDVIVVRTPNQEWIDAVGMDSCTTVGTGYDTADVDGSTCLDNPWTPASRTIHYERRITAVDGNRITIDSPVVEAFQAEFGGGAVYQYQFPGRIRQAGVEYLRAESSFASDIDEAHAERMIGLSNVEDAWVRNVTSVYFVQGTVLVGSGAKYVTVQDSASLDHKSQITGGRRYPFDIDDGSHVLVMRCYTRTGRHDYVTGSTTPGPTSSSTAAPSSRTPNWGRTTAGPPARSSTTSSTAASTAPRSWARTTAATSAAATAGPVPTRSSTTASATPTGCPARPTPATGPSAAGPPAGKAPANTTPTRLRSPHGASISNNSETGWATPPWPPSVTDAPCGRSHDVERSAAAPAAGAAVAGCDAAPGIRRGVRVTRRPEMGSRTMRCEPSTRDP